MPDTPAIITPEALAELEATAKQIQWSHEEARKVMRGIPSLAATIRALMADRDEAMNDLDSVYGILGNATEPAGHQVDVLMTSLEAARADLAKAQARIADAIAVVTLVSPALWVLRNILKIEGLSGGVTQADEMIAEAARLLQPEAEKEGEG